MSELLRVTLASPPRQRRDLLRSQPRKSSLSPNPKRLRRASIGVVVKKAEVAGDGTTVFLKIVSAAKSAELNGKLEVSLLLYQQARNMYPDDEMLISKVHDIQTRLINVTGMDCEEPDEDAAIERFARRQSVSNLDNAVKAVVEHQILHIFNSASKEALTSQHGIPPRRAILIMDARANGHYKDLVELSRVGMYHSEIVKMAKHDTLERLDCVSVF